MCKKQQKTSQNQQNEQKEDGGGTEGISLRLEKKLNVAKKKKTPKRKQTIGCGLRTGKGGRDQKRIKYECGCDHTIALFKTISGHNNQIKESCTLSYLKFQGNTIKKH